MLIGLSVAEPSEMPTSGRSPGELVGMPVVLDLALSGGMPMATAVSMIASGPSGMARVMSMKAVLIDSSVASRRLTVP
jgi:hypothetical protein